MTEAAFKRSIRDRQVWCSSCMVAFAGADPIGVLIGAKRSTRTLIDRIAVHPDHVRQGHGRHLLTSLSSKLAILGPPLLVTEVPATSTPACGLFEAAGYVEEAVLTDYVLDHAERRGPIAGVVDGFAMPISADDLAVNGLLADGRPECCWERSVETLTARKDDVAGLAIASDAGIDACLLYTPDGELLLLRSLVGDGGARLATLLDLVLTRHPGRLTFPKVHPDEISPGLLETLGFRTAGTHRVYQTRALSA